jgi:predicted Zn finger-like uncharacterized protein
MKITCGSCAAKYTVSDEKVQGKTVKVKCRKCGAVIVVSSTGEVQTTGGSTAPPAGSAAGAELTFTVSVSDTDQRNLTMPEVIQAYNEGVIDAETYVWAEGMDDWLPLKDVDAIVDALHDAATDDGGGDLGSTVAMDSPAAAAGAADFGSTVAMDSGMGAGMSPGGGLAAASSGGAAVSAPAGDTTGGFFGAMGSSGGGAGPAVSASAPVGGGDENSAIFSLNMLTSKVEEGGNGSGVTEDSGLIDLKALAAGMGGDEPEAAPAPIATAPSAGGLFPLGAPAAGPSVAPPSIPAPAAQAQSNRGMIMMLGGAVVLLGAALVFILVRDSGTPPPTASTSATTAEPAPTAAPAPTETVAAVEPSATASAATSASASATTKVAATPVPYKKKAGAAPASGGKKSSGGKKAKPKPKPKTGGCGCASDDLMCQMRCSTK